MRTLQICLSLVFLMMTNSLFSQQSQSDTSDYTIEKLFQYGLDELLTLKVNSATKFDESINEIPHSIFIITKKDIETYGYRTLAEALQHVPGFYMIDDYSAYKQNFGIRGFFRDEWNQNIVFIVNGIRQRMTTSFNNPLSYINIPIQSIERIEIIKGPASVTYGTGAFLGVVNIITSSQENKSDVFTSFGTQDTYSAGVNIHRKEDKLNYTINAGMGTSDGIDQNFNDMGLDTNLFSGKYMNEQFGYAGISVNSEYIYSSLTIDRNTNNRLMVSLPYMSDKYETKSEFNSFKYILGTNYQISDKILLNASYQYKYFQTELLFDLFGLDNNRESQTIKENSHEADANLKIQLFKKSHLSFGANYQYAGNYKDDLDIPLLGLTNQIKTLNSPMEIWGFYGRFAWSISDNIMFRSGLKLEKIYSYELQLDANVGNDYIDPTHSIMDSSFIATYTYPDYGYSALPELSLLWDINDKNSLKLIYAKAVNKLSIFRINKAVSGINPEYIHNFEINHTGIISDMLSINTSLFYSNYTDLIATEFYIENNTSIQIANNSGKIRTIGAELALDYRPLKELRIYAAGNYNNSKDLNHKSVYPSFSPKFLGVLNISYNIHTFTLALTNHYVSETEPNYSYALSNPSDFNSAPIGRVGDTAPAYLNTGLNIIYKPNFLKRFSANLRISNIFNQKMYYPMNNTNSFSTKGTLGIGRTILVGMNYKF